MALGGKRPNSGRKPIEKRLSNYEKAIRILDDNIEDALNVLIKGLKDKDKNYKYRCAELLLKKAIPDRNFNLNLDADITDKTEEEINKMAIEIYERQRNNGKK